MKRFIYFLVLGALLAGCKPSEKAYKAAYEATVAHRNETDSPVAGTVFNRYRQAARTSYVLTEDGDTLGVRVEAIGFPKETGTERDRMKMYSVVVAQFKQVFNAQAMRDRLAGFGYEPFIVATREPLYYVVAGTFETPTEADRFAKKIVSDDRFKVQKDCPWVLQPVHLMK